MMGFVDEIAMAGVGGSGGAPVQGIGQHQRLKRLQVQGHGGADGAPGAHVRQHLQRLLHGPGCGVVARQQLVVLAREARGGGGLGHGGLLWWAWVAVVAGFLAVGGAIMVHKRATCKLLSWSYGHRNEVA